MEIAWQDWAGLLIRWLHLATGIAWIGTSFYFIWLDQSLRRRQQMAPGVDGESWSVHGGGFYHVQKYMVAPEQLPEELHWFKYEANNCQPRLPRRRLAGLRSALPITDRQAHGPARPVGICSDRTDRLGSKSAFQ